MYSDSDTIYRYNYVIINGYNSQLPVYDKNVKLLVSYLPTYLHTLL